jgi:heme/copper-type cytochrome/quinol oxidase subunit 3
MVLAACVLTREISDSQFSDVDDNAGYWSFVVVTWLPIYALVYWGPRLL